MQSATTNTDGDDDGAPRSERVPIAPGWEFESTGAGNVGECAWLLASGPGEVMIVFEDVFGRTCIKRVPCAVVAHVLRVQGYAVEERLEAG